MEQTEGTEENKSGPRIGSIRTNSEKKNLAEVERAGWQRDRSKSTGCATAWPFRTSSAHCYARPSKFASPLPLSTVCQRSGGLEKSLRKTVSSKGHVESALLVRSGQAVARHVDSRREQCHLALSQRELRVVTRVEWDLPKTLVISVQVPLGRFV
jgi:hypothetical protein